MLYVVDDSGQVQFGGKLDTSTKKEAAGLSAMKKFQSFDRNARLENDTVLDTIHQNAITCVCVYQGAKGNATRVSTSGNDGQLVIWDLQSVEGGMQGLKIN
uniref:Uncharacterized protein n=2 Tax=Homalodisca liturata TaxID=320908 RepID=A0A1B6HT45_9HEMI